MQAPPTNCDPQQLDRCMNFLYYRTHRLLEKHGSQWIPEVPAEQLTLDLRPSSPTPSGHDTTFNCPQYRSSRVSLAVCPVSVLNSMLSSPGNLTNKESELARDLPRQLLDLMSQPVLRMPDSFTGLVRMLACAKCCPEMRGLGSPREDQGLLKNLLLAIGEIMLICAGFAFANKDLYVLVGMRIVERLASPGERFKGPRAALFLRLLSSFPIHDRSRSIIEYVGLISCLCWSDIEFANAVMKILFEVLADVQVDLFIATVSDECQKVPHLSVLPWHAYHQMRITYRARLEHALKAVKFDTEHTPGSERMSSVLTFCDRYSQSEFSDLLSRRSPSLDDMAKWLCDSMERHQAHSSGGTPSDLAAEFMDMFGVPMGPYA